MKKVLIGLLALSGMIIGIAIGASFYINSFLDNKNIAKVSQKFLGAPLSLAQTPDWTFFPPGITFKNLSWKNARNNAIYDISIKKCTLTLEFIPLFKKNFVFREVALTNPRINIHLKNASARANTTQNSLNQPATISYLNELPISVSKLNIRQGELTLLSSAKEYRLNHFNLTAENLKINQDFPVRCDFILRGNNAADLPGTNIAMQTRLKFSPLAISFQDTAVAITPINDEINDIIPISVKFNSTLDFNRLSFTLSGSQIEREEMLLSLAGNGTLYPLQFDGLFDFSLRKNIVKTNRTPFLSVKGPISYSNSSLKLPDVNVSLLGNNGNGKLSMELANKDLDPIITGELTFAQINISPIEEHSDTTAAKDENKHTASEDDFSALPNLQLDLKIGTLRWNDLIFNNIYMPLKVQDAILEIKPAHFNWAGGKTEASVLMDMKGRQNDLLVMAKDINLGKGLEELGIPGIINGKATLSAHFSATGNDWQSMKSGLNGNLQITGENATIKFLEEIAQNLPALFDMKKYLPERIENIYVKCAANKGVLYCNPITLAAPGIACNGTANLELASDSINGTLAIKAGSANIPINFNGPLNNISWHPGTGFLEEIRKIFH